MTTFKQRPAGLATVNFQDCTLLIDAQAPSNNRIKQIARRPENQCYYGVDMELAYKAPDWAEDKLRCFLATSFAGNKEGRLIDLAMEALCWYNEDIPQVQILFTGHGGNSKSARTLLRANVFGEAHGVMAPEVFQVPDEFQKQGLHFAG